MACWNKPKFISKCLFFLLFLCVFAVLFSLLARIKLNVYQQFRKATETAGDERNPLAFFFVFLAAFSRFLTNWTPSLTQGIRERGKVFCLFLSISPRPLFNLSVCVYVPVVCVYTCECYWPCLWRLPVPDPLTRVQISLCSILWAPKRTQRMSWGEEKKTKRNE